MAIRIAAITRDNAYERSILIFFIVLKVRFSVTCHVEFSVNALWNEITEICLTNNTLRNFF